MITCACCSHTIHPGHSCPQKQCYCLKSIEDHGADLPIEVDNWQTGVMMGVLELVTQDEEGELHVKTNDGRICVVKLTLRPEIRYTAIGIGKA